MAKPNTRCVRCNQKMRNDGTAELPQWVCNNPKCVRYVPDEPETQEVVAENATTTTEEETDLES